MSRRFDWWCKTAVDQIRYRPDRDAVYQELYAHLEDHYDTATDCGLSPKEAEEAALMAMGSASELAPLLSSIHRPWWGYALVGTRCLLCIVAIAAVLQIYGFFRTNSISQSQTPWYYEKPGEELVNLWEDGSGESRRILDIFPDATDRSDGFTFDVTRAVMTFHDLYTDDSQDSYYFWFRIQVSNPLQWALMDEIHLHDFWAVDSLGNIYCSYNNSAYSSQCFVSGNYEKTGLFSCTLDMWLTNFCSPEAEWIEIRYDRNGRDIRLRIDLTGGDDE